MSNERICINIEDFKMPDLFSMPNFRDIFRETIEFDEYEIEESLEAKTEYNEVLNEIKDVLYKYLTIRDVGNLTNNLYRSHSKVVFEAEALGFEVGIKFALGLITQNNLIKCKE